MSAEEMGREALAWIDFMRFHGDDIEDAMLDAASEFERENPPKMELARPTWAEVKNIKPVGAVIEFVDPIDDTTEMRHWRAVAEDGTTMEGFIPSVIPEDGMKVRINGVFGILYIHPSDGEIHLDEATPDPESEESDDETQSQLMEMSKVDARIVGYNPLTERQLYGLSLTDEFVASLIEAWAHIGHGGQCQETAESYLTRFIEQMIGSFTTGIAKKEAL